mgnify:CR=1 FL=1
MDSFTSYFLTDGIICNHNDFNKIMSTYSSSKSILSLYKNNINRNKNKKKYFNKNDLIKIQNFFEEFKNYNDINLFCSKLISLKFNLKEKINYIDKNTNTNTNNKTYLNPLYELNIKNSIIQKNINNYTIGTSNNLKIQLDILYYGKYINYKLPSLGIIDNKFSNIKNNNNKININFLKDYFTSPSSYNLIKLPIFHLNISETITNILIDKSKHINNINKIKEILINTLKNIETSINIENIIKDHSKKKSFTIKEDYIIPFIIKNTEPYLVPIKKKSEIKIYKSKENYINQMKNIYELIKVCIENKILDKNLYKLLALYLYLHIVIFYDLHKDYIDKLTNTLSKLKNSDDSYFNKLNFTDTFKYINDLSSSIFIMKKILLNNFYDLFLPTSIDNNMYGVLKNSETNVYEIDPKASLIGNKIIENYPLFNKEENMLNFIINFKQYDLYNKKEKLEIGIFYYNNKYFSNAQNIYKNYLNQYSIIDKNNLIIINYIKKYFEKCIIIEQIQLIKNKYRYLKKDDLNSEEKSILENILFDFFKDNLNKSLDGILNSLEHKKFSYKKEIEILKSKMYYNIAKNTFEIIENILTNIDLKNTLIRKCSILEENYYKKINKKINIIDK